MKRFFSIAVASIVGISLSVGVLTQVAKAQDATIAPGLTLSAGYLGYNMHYSENIPTLSSVGSIVAPDVIVASGVNVTQIAHDSENGWMNGFYLKLCYLSPFKTFLGNFETGLEFQYAHSGIDYSGSGSQTITREVTSSRSLWSNKENYTSQDKATIFSIELKPGFMQNLSRNFSLSEYVIFGYRHWIRDIENTYANSQYNIVEGVTHSESQIIPMQGVSESYVNGYIGLGAKINAYLGNFVAGLDVSGKLSPRWSGINYMYFQGNTYHMGKALNFEVALPISYNINEHFSINTKPFYSYWRFSHSDWVNGIMEPDSETNSLGLQLGLSYKF